MRLRLCMFLSASMGLSCAGSAQVVQPVRFSQPPVIHVSGDLKPVGGTVAFSLATNTGFEIAITRPDKDLIEPGRLGEAGFVIGIAETGENAKAAGGPVWEAKAGRITVWRAHERTAFRRGDIASQSATFTASWQPGALDFEPEFVISAMP